MFRGSGHYFGMFFMSIIVIAVLGLSLTLSITFFQAITPPGKEWFPYLGLSLTEGGFGCWLMAFLLLRYHGFHTAVALIMSLLSFVGIICTAGLELFSLMPGTSINVHAALFANAAGALLDLIFLANLLSTPLAFIVHYTEKHPGWWSGKRDLIPLKWEQTGPLLAPVKGGEDTDPLALRQLSQTGQEPVTLSAVGQAAKQAGSTLMQKVTKNTGRGMKGGRVHGETSQTISGSTSSQTDYPSAPVIEDVSEIIPIDELRG